MRCKVKQGCWHYAYVDDVTAGITQTLYQGFRQFGAGRSAIASHCQRCLALGPGFAANCLADFFDHLSSQCLTDNSTNVICAKNTL